MPACEVAAHVHGGGFVMALTDFFVKCVFLDKITLPDGYGGITTVYRNGAEFDAGIATNQSTEAEIAYQNGLKVLYSIVTTDLINLRQGDVIRRLSDGLTLRVTSDASDMHTPPMASQQYIKVTGEAVKV